MMHNQGNALPAGAADRLWSEAERLREPMVAFLQSVVRTPSLPGQEGEVAALVANEMRSLGYDEVSVDAAGNVIGLVRATGEEPDRPRKSLMFNTHMDHVDVGDPGKWPFPPYEATLHEGEVWGRATSDLKGSMAAQVYTGALLKRSGMPLPNDVYVVAVVQEEVGGLGSSELGKHLKTDYLVIGEPSDNILALGHRGRTEIWVTITGRSVHASVPGLGVNPLYSLARFLEGLQELRFDADPHYPELGPTTVAPTLITTDQTSANVVPGEVTQVLDFRTTPADSPEALVSKVRELLEASLEKGATGVARVMPVTLTSYTGVSRVYSNAAPPFGVLPDSTLLAGAKAGLSAVLGREAQTKIWPFTTDAGHFVGPGVDIIGYGPGREEVIHTVNERISVDQMVEAMVGNAAIALAVR